MKTTVGWILLTLGTVACSYVDYDYLQPRYRPANDDTVKRIAVAAWAPAEHQPLAQVLAQVGSDRIKLRKNYLVYTQAVVTRDWSETCGDRQGVLMLRPLDVRRTSTDTTLNLSAALYDCRTGALVWEVRGDTTHEAGDADLAQTVSTYRQSLGEDATPYIATAFVLLQDLLDAAPNPDLSDDDIMEKIELE